VASAKVASPINNGRGARVARVVLTPAAKDDVRALDGAARKLVLKAMKKLEDHPESRGAPLGSRTGSNLTGFRKLVVGDHQYRIVYRVEADGSVCVVWVVGSRVDSECYEAARSRVELYATDPGLAATLTHLLDAAFEAPRRDL
jgi:mRNA interferase RelE/StbE